MNMDNDTHIYDDIINLPHPTSQKHPRMSLYDRAAQFSPFAALTGHDAAIKETARFTEKQTEQSEDIVSRLNEKLQIISDNPGTEITVTYFVPDERKMGGAYVSHTGIVKKIDDYEHTLVMEDRTIIPINQINEIECSLFGEMGIYE